MCGRFAFFAPPDAIAREFCVLPPEAVEPRYNIAPTQAVAAVRVDAEGSRSVGMLRWGLVPSWAKDPSIGNRMINARAETLAERPAFRAALARRRCLILASGFYEWGQTPFGKRPFYISSSTGAIIAFAGLWERWDKGDAEPLETCTIVTTSANSLVTRVHDRMPVILTPHARTRWLEAGTVADCMSVLRRLDETRLDMWDVSTRVNDPRNEGAELIEPAPHPSQ